MTELRPQTGPLPHASSHLSVPFWQGCQSRELRYQRCDACGLANFPPTEHCRQCLSAELRWANSAGSGEIYSWTVVSRPVTPEFEPPYAPAIVTLDEGYQLLTNVVGVAPDELAIGMRVQVDFHVVDPDLTLPYFTSRK
ncbi:putative nucleic-acid-binding protein containing a Zn-ribbon [Mycobacterium lentiflavum]|uniref:OB-fold domain-containing protein n=1 Tax=Mycobacterium lentiflavum TaxID=141349 RepID=A0A0E3WB14_MYCLN|nr:OB-fold domain-containing protein [Mycobacterium lentiflavum]ULP42629.1 OB-fold domain-containing protein [Mycobacterium lentiflavum]CQD03171.1 putative nucleic-acid-binding protein containing a Zn-ribbon [Mycobacterium lentiflavum]